MGRRFKELDSLRFIFAFEVMLGHLVRLVDYIPKWTISVEFFFVLSGFVLAHALRERPQSYREFAIARFARLVPLHWLTLIFFTGWCVWFGWTRLLTVEGFVWNFFLLHVIVVKEMNFNWPSWSIAIEFWCNVTFFYFVVAGRMIRTAFAIAILGGSLYIAKRQNIAWLSWLFDEIPRGALCLMLGYLTYEFYRSGSMRQVWKNRIVHNIAIMAVLIALVLVYITPYTTASYLMGVAVMPVLIWLMAAEENFLARALAIRPLTYLGSLSFSVYLLHYPIYAASRAAGWTDYPLTWTQLAALITIIMVAAVFCYRLFERPVQKWIIRSLAARRIAVATAA